MTHGALTTVHPMAAVPSSRNASHPCDAIQGHRHPKKKGPSPRLEAPHLLTGSCISIFLLLLLVEAQLHDESAMPLELVMEMMLR